MVSIPHKSIHLMDGSPCEDSPLEEVDSEISLLTWAVLDGVATPEQHARLSLLVAEQQHLRQKFLETVQTECDLYAIFGNRQTRDNLLRSIGMAGRTGGAR